ncbi:MAG: ubiquitin-like protein Pup [Actinomycetaceae bacterium]|nr:ubiquitin-like protein Pup [Actinomycetaceae bacterium]
MAERIQRSAQNYDVPDVPEPDLPTGGGGAGQGAAMESVLDSIDEVLALNAQDFVQSFVQMGGQ